MASTTDPAKRPLIDPQVPGVPQPGVAQPGVNTGSATGGGATTLGIGAMGRPQASIPLGTNPSSVQQVGPGNNLIGTQIAPGNPSSRLNTAQGYAQDAAQQYQNAPTPTLRTVGAFDPTDARAALDSGRAIAQSTSVSPYQAVAPTDLSQAQAFLAKAAGAAGPSSELTALAGPGATGSFGFSGDTGDIRNMTADQLRRVLNETPDRNALSSEAYRLLEEESLPGYQQLERQTGQNIAKFGRVGSGMSNSELVDLATARERMLDQGRRTLSLDAADKALADQALKLNSANQTLSNFGGLDLGAGNLNLGYTQAANAERNAAFNRWNALQGDTFNNNRLLAGDAAEMAGIARRDAVNERDARISTEDRSNTNAFDRADAERTYGSDIYGIGRDLYDDDVARSRDDYNASRDAVGDARTRFQDMVGYEDTVRGWESGERDELRGERTNQEALDQRAIDNRRQQMLDEEWLYGNEFDRGTRQFDVGYNPNTGRTYQDAADAAGQAGADAIGASGDLLTEWMRRRNGPQGRSPFNVPPLTVPDFEVPEVRAY